MLNECSKDKIIDLNDIDTSEITDMSYLFISFKKNFDVSGWYVSNVTDMSYMFYGCKKFNCDLSNWDISNVNNMHDMFISCNNFNGNLIESWGKIIKKTCNTISMFKSSNSTPNWYKKLIN